MLVHGAPNFTTSESTVILTENVDPPQINFHDLTCNGTNITYNITTPSVPFSISASGMLSANSVLNYEETTNYTLSVICFDPAVPGEVGRTTVHILLMPVNEYRPKFPSQSSLAVLVSEIEPLGTILFSRTAGRGRRQYTVIDRDAGPDGDIFFTLNSPDDPEIDRYFSINRTTGDITIKQTLDIDSGANTTFSIKFTACDCDCDPPNDTCPNKVVTVFVFAVNDNYPQFTKQFYQVNISENTPEGTIVLNATCTDADVMVGSSITVDFQNPADDVGFTPNTDVTQAFNINPNGRITVVSIDHETMQNYTFKLKCTDEYGLSNTTTVSITVGNEADEVPVFTQVTILQNYTIATYPPGTQVAVVQCIDGDAAFNASISYSIVDPSGQFSIQNDGRVKINRTLQPFDMYRTCYVITVICSEAMPPYFTANHSLTLEVIKNDTTPPSISFPLPSGGIHRFNILEDATNGYVIAVIAAEDPDSPRVIFSLRGNIGNTFSINSTTGLFMVESSLDRETISSYLLTVIATEERLLPGVAQSGSVEVEVIIGDVNDNHPTCSQTNAETSLEAGRHHSVTVYTLNCTDRDQGRNSELSYSILSTDPSVPDGEFRVSGPALVFHGTAKAFDSFTVAMSISDGGTPQLSTTLQVKVNVIAAGFTFPLFIVIVVIILVVIIVFVLLTLCVLIGCVYCDNHKKKYRRNTIVGYVTCYYYIYCRVHALL